jgi:hypothetical protein
VQGHFLGLLRLSSPGLSRRSSAAVGGLDGRVKPGHDNQSRATPAPLSPLRTPA